MVKGCLADRVAACRSTRDDCRTTAFGNSAASGPIAAWASYPAGAELDNNSYLGASTVLSSWIVNVEPRPGSLSTVMSPRRLITTQGRCRRICSRRIHLDNLHHAEAPRNSSYGSDGQNAR